MIIYRMTERERCAKIIILNKFHMENICFILKDKYWRINILLLLKIFH